MNKEKMWAILVHLGNWGGGGSQEMNYDSLLFDDDSWNYIVDEVAAAGLNTLIIDICGGIDFASHPEITVKGAWTRKRLRDEIAKCREKGLTLIPKLNFATVHSKWLKKYSRMISTPEYYQVCNDLIKEAYELFEHPKYIHLGMDEEDAKHAKTEELAIYRQGELYWHDVRFLIDCVKDTGATPWMWSCPLFDNPEEYKKHIDADEAILSPWYYNAFREEHYTPVASKQLYIDYYKQPEYKGMDIKYIEDDPFLVRFRELAVPLLKAEGYKYAPAGSVCNRCDYNIIEMVEYFKERAPEEQIPGYVMTVWKPTIPKYKGEVDRAIKLMKEAKEKFYK
ncbi:MAG: hypothetical protein IJN99_02425 [Clostridia bacterium]|nr:hypothetical protein [Clostridia bacterium]